MPSQRLLQVTASTQRRGAELHAEALGSALTERGWTVDTVAVRATADGLRFEILGTGRRNLATLVDLRRHLGHHDVAIAHGSASLMACAASFSRTAFVYRSIGDPSFWLAPRSRRWRVAAYLRRASGVVALWPQAARFFVERVGVAAEKMHVIPNAVNAERFTPPGQDEKRRARRELGLVGGDQLVLYLGSLSREKNPMLAVEAIRGIDRARLLVVGDGPLAAELEAATAEGTVVLAGPVDDPVVALHAADVLVVPSDTEGMPAVVIEAGLVGLPTVATAVGAIPDMVVDGVTGRIAPPRDAAALRAALVGALADSGPLGEAARARCLDVYTVARVAPMWDELLARYCR